MIFLDEHHQLYSHITINHNDIFLNNQIKQAFNEHTLSTIYTMNDYVFKSNKSIEPITRQQAYRIIHDTARKVGLSENIGTHTFAKHSVIMRIRKAFLFHLYNNDSTTLVHQKH